MSFFDSKRKKVQNEQSDTIHSEINNDQLNIDEEISDEEMPVTKRKQTIFDQMEVDHSASNTEPLTWDPKPFNDRDHLETTSSTTNQEEPKLDTKEEPLNDQQVDKELVDSTDNSNKVENDEHVENVIENSSQQTQEEAIQAGNGIEEFKVEISGLNAYIEDRFVSVDKQLHKLSNDFETKLKYDQHKDTVIDNLHKELQMYKDNSFQERLMPVIMDLILSIDRTGKMLKGLPEGEEFKKYIKVINESIMDLEDILYKQGVEAYETDGLNFDSLRQKVVKTVKTDQQELDKQIAERLGKGYEWEERIIRKEQVTVYVYEETAAAK